MSVKIRKATASDIDDVFRLLNELRVCAYREMGKTYVAQEISDQSKELFSKIIDHEENHIIVAEDNGKIVGLCVSHETPKLLEGSTRLLIEEMIVDESCRGKGIGSKMLEYMEELAKDKGIKYIKLTTGTNLQANEFYKKKGFIHFENAYRKEIS